MGDIGTCGTGGQGGGSSVGKQVEHPRRTDLAHLRIVGSETGYLPVDEIPVRSLLGKHADMLECRKSQA